MNRDAVWQLDARIESFGALVSNVVIGNVSMVKGFMLERFNVVWSFGVLVHVCYVLLDQGHRHCLIRTGRTRMFYTTTGPFSNLMDHSKMHCQGVQFAVGLITIGASKRLVIVVMPLDHVSSTWHCLFMDRLPYPLARFGFFLCRRWGVIHVIQVHFRFHAKVSDITLQNVTRTVVGIILKLLVFKVFKVSL